MNQNYMRALPVTWRKTAAVFMALGDANRQRILLSFEKDERLTVTQLAAVAPLSRTAVVHHIKVLEAAGVLSCEKIGREVYLSINKQVLRNTLQAVLSYMDESI